MAAQRIHGTVAVTSAALIHGWSVAQQPDRPWVSVPRNRKLTKEQSAGVRVIRTSARGNVTTPLQTVIDCARHLPFADALAIADSALRAGDVGIVQLIATANGARGPGASKVRRVAQEASVLAASPLESVLRAHARDVGLNVIPQMEIELPGFTIHPDLVDPDLRIVIEGDTWFHHASTPDMFNRDVERYTMLAAEGWLVLRFIWQEAMRKPDYVRTTLRKAMDLRAQERTKAA